MSPVPPALRQGAPCPTASPAGATVPSPRPCSRPWPSRSPRSWRHRRPAAPSAPRPARTAGPAGVEPAHQPGPPRLALGPGDPARPGRPHDVPPRGGAGDRRPVDLRRAQPRRQLQARRRRGLRPRDRHLGPGRVQRRRREPRGGRLPAALAGHRLDRRASSRRTRCCAASPTCRRRPARTPATWCCGCSPTGPSTPAPTRLSCPTPPTATRPSGWRGRSGRSVRATRPSRSPTPRSRGFLRDRLELSIDAVDRQVLDRYGDHLDIDGQPAPAWLIADGGDATAEAVLGLSAYVEAGGSAPARTDPVEAERGHRGARWRERPHAGRWEPIRPWAPSRSMWHGWGAPDARRPGARPPWPWATAAWPRVPSRDSFTFDPWLLTSGGPDNGRLPTRGDTSQIAYGADSRLQSLLATADATGDGGRARSRRDRGGVVLRRQPRRRGDVRPGHRPDLRRHLQRPARSTTTPEPSPRSTACSR